MKKLLFATVFASTAIASSMGCNADSLTGLHFGLGVSVLFDKYEADVDVATIMDNIGKTGADIVAANKKLYKSVTFTSANSVTKANVVNNQEANINVVSWLTDQANTEGALANIADTEIDNSTLAVQTILTAGSTPGRLNVYKTAYTKQEIFKKRTTNCGGEIKLAYFHDFGNHLMVGVDLTGVIASKNKKTVEVKAKQIEDNTTTGGDLRLHGEIIAEGTAMTQRCIDIANKLSDGANLVLTTDQLEITNMPALKAANPDYTIMTAAQLNELPGNFALKTQTGNEAELTFEKGVFNPRLAFIVGGTVYGWFAGLRMGMSYTTGKVYAKGLDQDKMSKTVSISSPLIGLHLMKQMKIAGNNDAHLYLTADWNIGDGRRTVDINGVKSFRQTGYNISAGLTWRFKLGN